MGYNRSLHEQTGTELYLFYLFYTFHVYLKFNIIYLLAYAEFKSVYKRR